MTELHGFDEKVVVDTSERDPVYLLTTAEGRYLRCSHSAFHLLRLFRSGASAEEIAARFSRGEGPAVTAEQVQAAYDRVMERVRELDRAVEPSAMGLKYPRRIIPAALVRRMSDPLAGLFQPAAVLALMAYVAGGIYFLAEGMRAVDVPALLASNLWWGYTLFFGSLVAHEFGHASACARFGARPADIGIGIYFIYPALYSDVTDAWRLSRWERVIVDIGGVYFQAAVGALYVYAYLVTQWGPLLLAGIFIAANCLFSLNPIFKFDGYWVISDALGVTNLRSDARHVLAALRDRLLGRQARGRRWSRAIAVTILICGALAAVAWTFFMIRVLPMLWGHVSRYPELLSAFVRDLFRGEMGWSRAFTFLLSTYFTVLGVRMVYDLARRWTARALKAAGIDLAEMGARLRRRFRRDATSPAGGGAPAA